MAIVVARLWDFWISGNLQSVGKNLRKRKIESSPEKAGYFWAGESLPFEEACKHFVSIGSTGSGKSITLNLLILSVISKMGRRDGVRRRALIYDPKSDLGSFVAAIQPGVPIRIMNPLDKRFNPWDIAADVTGETEAFEFASVLIPRSERENSPYFSDVARSLVAGVIKRFIATAAPAERMRWTLRDLVLACESTQRLRAALDYEGTRHLLEHFQPDNARNFAGVKSTLDNTMNLYRPIAALSDAAKSPPVSIKRWIQEEESVLILGNHEAAREATDTLNRLLFRQLSKSLIDRQGRIEGDETWVFLDEVREAGVLGGLRQLLLRGRSKGVSVAMSLQDVEGMYAAYGRHEGAEIVGAAQNVAILHLNPSAPGTVELASKIFGSRRGRVAGHSESLTEERGSTKNRHFELIPNVLPVEFVELPMPGKRTGLHYFAFTNTGGFGRGHFPWRFLEEAGPLHLRKEGYADIEPQTDGNAFQLRAWNKEDLTRLGMEEMEISLERNRSELTPQVPHSLETIHNTDYSNLRERSTPGSH
ncbi:MAG: type IV secretion system DNA-binding domain-containing protein [Verrucomicrobiota bacterium]